MLSLKTWSVRALVLASMLGATVGASADAPKVTDAGPVTNLHVYDATGATFVDGPKDQCATGRYRLDPKHVKYDNIMSLLLAAELSGRSVQIRYDTCNEQGQGNIIGVYLK